MRRIRASEAKARFAKLLTEVEGGATVLVTRHGRPIARIVPEIDRRRAEIAAAVDGIRELRRSTRGMSLTEILHARDQGRR